MKNKKQAIFLDAAILQSCNLMCQYCRSNLFYDKKEIRQVPSQIRLLKSLDKIIDYDIFKISGYGEITLAELESSISAIAHKRAMFITNGLRLNKSLEILLSHPDPVINISLDGHTSEMNRYRNLSQAQINDLLYIIQELNGSIPVEINSVLTSANCNFFHEFVSLMQSRASAVILFPFPVRTFPFMRRKNFFPSPDQIKLFEEELVENYEKYSSVLPPALYMQELVKFLKKGYRTNSCTVPSFVVGVDEKLDIHGCLCGPEEILGKVDEELDNRLEKINQYLLSNVKGKWKQCAECFNHYEVISLYLKGRIKETEISRVPSLSKDSILTHLQKIKSEYND